LANVNFKGYSSHFQQKLSCLTPVIVLQCSSVNIQPPFTAGVAWLSDDYW